MWESNRFDQRISAITLESWEHEGINTDSALSRMCGKHTHSDVHARMWIKFEMKNKYHISCYRIDFIVSKFSKMNAIYIRMVAQMNFS